MENVKRVTLFNSIKEVLKDYGIDSSNFENADIYVDLLEDLFGVAYDFGACSTRKIEVDN